MKLKRKLHWGVSVAAVLVLILAAVALADNTFPDGDGTTPVDANPLNLGTVCLGGTIEDDVLIAISRNGSYTSTNVFKAGTTVTITVQSVTGSGLSATMTSTTITLPDNWGTLPNNTMSEYVTSHVTFQPTELGLFEGTIVYRATGTSSRDGGTLTRDGKLKVYATVVVCDTTPPVITPNVSGTLGNNGWYVSNVTVTWTVSDPESEITSTSGCDSTTIDYDTEGVTLTCSATSAGGTSSESVTIKRDATAPTVTVTRDRDPNANGWYNSDVTVSFTCGDGTSGIASCGPDQTLSGEGAGQSVTGTAVDNAGNSASATVSGINIDKTPPTASASASPEPNANGWYNSDVTVSFSGSDGLSGIDFCSAAVVLRSEGAGQSASGTCTDKAGNSASATVGDINIDKTPPTIIAALNKEPASSGWYNASTGAPTVSFTCSDNLSGLAGDCPKDYTFGEGADQSYSQTISDKAGNSATAEVSDIDVDLTAPTLTIVVPAPYDVRPYGTALNFYAEDTLSGLAGPAMASLNGGEPQPSGYVPPVGVYFVRIYAFDKAGNEASETRQLVIYDPSAGFVTGGGWIWSPKGAYGPDPNLEGKATFGFVSKYQKGAKVPTGETQFQFHAGNLNFHSNSYEWLVVAGAKAQFKGVGTVNGVSGYGFLLTAIDGQINGGGGVDKFRIKIWSLATGEVIYDNQWGKDDYGDAATALGGGSIVIHTK